MTNNSIYSVDNSGIHQAHGDHSHSIAWEDVLGLKQSLFSGALSIRGRRFSFPLARDASDTPALLEKFFRGWEQKFPEAAKKNAFDFAFPNKAFAGILLVTCIILALPFGGALLKDSLDQSACTKQLSSGSLAATATITKIRKQRKGHYIMGLNFTAADGTLVTGHDQFITEDETNPPANIPVVYAKENPHCWTTPSSINKNEVNWAKRRYFSAFTLLFASFSLLSGVLGIIFSLLRLREKRAHAEFVSKLFALR